MRGALGDLATALLAVAAVLLLAALARRVAESEAPPGRVAIGPLADPHVIAERIKEKALAAARSRVVGAVCYF